MLDDVKNTPVTYPESKYPPDGKAPVAFGIPAWLCVPASASPTSPQFRKDLRHPQKPSSSRWLRRGQRFFRNWGPGADSQAGGWGRDEIRNITGNIGFAHAGSRNGTGALKPSGGSQVFDHWDGSYLSSNTSLGFDASLSIPTGPQNVPQHVWQPLVIYLGRSS